MRIKLSSIDERAPHRPADYKERILAAGKIDGDEIEIPDTVYKSLCDEFRNEGPTIPELFVNFSKATTNWIAAGFPIVSEQVFKRRLGVTGCATCEHFDVIARGHRGKCNHKDCGCTAEWKAAWATETCPIGRAGWA